MHNARARHFWRNFTARRIPNHLSRAPYFHKSSAVLSCPQNIPLAQHLYTFPFTVQRARYNRNELVNPQTSPLALRFFTHHQWCSHAYPCPLRSVSYTHISHLNLYKITVESRILNSNRNIFLDPLKPHFTLASKRIVLSAQNWLTGSS